MIDLQKTNSKNPDFGKLIVKLDEYLAVCDGDEHSFYDSHNKLDLINHVIVMYEDKIPVGCGALKEFKGGTMEVKRMFVDSAYRKKGYAGLILRELEKWALEMGYSACVLETGKRQIEAVGFYKKNGYYLIEKYPPYEGMENSICFKKDLI
ncbi:GNAT family N-acetyltransferase [Gramella sp. AN32]|uniref:GNAT family N-acetyltransferase n=1 Tax=Christiangramia antarctica TaxID=2058158 RepID=A0ABW5X0D5_9FLAO|nr:GNAT family N-acetyltransferase [Gramella sp. AN32]MCM4156842.1 GNAT family N-acetyltransferase [Gramella sp. AN32]